MICRTLLRGGLPFRGGDLRKPPLKSEVAAADEWATWMHNRRARCCELSAPMGIEMRFNFTCSCETSRKPLAKDHTELCEFKRHDNKLQEPRCGALGSRTCASVCDSGL